MPNKSTEINKSETKPSEEKPVLVNEAILAFLHQHFIWETPRNLDDDKD